MNHRNNARRFFAMIAIVFAIQNSVGYAQPDVYLSFSAFGDGNAVNNTFINVPIGNPVSAYIWVDENFSIDTSGCFSIVRSGDASVDIIGVEVFNPDIVDQGNGQTVNQRWQAVSFDPVSVDSAENICGTAVGGGTGILPSQSSGNVHVDTLHDDPSEAFLFARVDLVVVTCGLTNLGFDSGVVIDNGVPIVTSFGSAITINAFNPIILGDVNLDGVVSLLDVNPFIELIFSATYQIEGDINMDGFVNVHDIPLFIVGLNSGGFSCDP